MTVVHDGVGIDYFDLASIRLESPEGTVVFFDPGRYGILDDYDRADADLICVSHIHHYDPEAIQRVASEDATVVVHEAVHHSETDRDVTPVRDLSTDVQRVDDETDSLHGEVVVRTLAAYNLPDGPHTDDHGEPHHPEGRGCGFLVTIDGVTVCWPGDTDVLDGHAALDVDVFLPPIGGTFTMDRHEAAALASDLDPALVIPAHYDTFEPIEADAGAFAADLEAEGIPVVLDP